MVIPFSHYPFLEIQQPWAPPAFTDYYIKSGKHK